MTTYEQKIEAQCQRMADERRTTEYLTILKQTIVNRQTADTMRMLADPDFEDIRKLLNLSYLCFDNEPKIAPFQVVHEVVYKCIPDCKCSDSFVDRLVRAFVKSNGTYCLLEQLIDLILYGDGKLTWQHLILLIESGISRLSVEFICKKTMIHGYRVKGMNEYIDYLVDKYVSDGIIVTAK